MPTKKKLLIFIPDGVGIKNYLLSDFIRYCCETFEVILAHNFNTAIHEEINTPKGNYKTVNIPAYGETLKHKFLRESICFARLQYNSKLKANPSIMVNWRRKYKHFFKNVFYRAAEVYGMYLSKSYNRIKNKTINYHSIVKDSPSIRGFKDLLEMVSPDVVFTTHQRALDNIPLFAAAKALNITSVSVVYSWDNMPKARIPYFSDYFFVWSEYMKKEFDEYYPEINDDVIKITGTPQFEFYADKNIIESKSAFFKKHKLDINRPLVCYSGDDKLTSPFDPDYLRDMAQVFLEMEKSKRPQIILRPSPADDGFRFQTVLKQFPDICYAPADWFQIDDKTHWAVKFPKKNDIKQLVNLAFHADAVVNLGSTMAHDFAMFNKPAFYVNYMPEPSKVSLINTFSNNWSVKTIYQYEHFKSMNGLKPVHWINNSNDYFKVVDVLKGKDLSVSRDQQKWKDRIIGEDLYKNASQNLVQELLNLA
jgi:hypothetical protein